MAMNAAPALSSSANTTIARRACARRSRVVRRADADDDQREYERHDRHLQGVEPEPADRLGKACSLRCEYRIEPGEQHAGVAPAIRPSGCGSYSTCGMHH
jgi:hypothetical protein